MKLLVATRSPGKRREASRILGGSGIEVLFPDQLGLYPESVEPGLELGDTFAANARAKAEHFARKGGLPTVADDSGLEVFSLGGEPGARSRRWAGATGNDAELDAANNAFLLQRLLGAPTEKRRARYRCVLVLYRTSQGIPEVFEGACTGRILEVARGDEGFGYDPLFWSDDLKKSFGEAGPEEKDAVSHRGRAFRALRDALLPAQEP